MRMNQSSKTSPMKKKILLVVLKDKAIQSIFQIIFSFGAIDLLNLFTFLTNLNGT